MPAIVWRTLIIGILLTSVRSGFAQTAKPAVTWYKVMKGVIDTYPVTVFLFYVRGNMDGLYYYDRSGQPIEVSGTLRDGRWSATMDKESIAAAYTDSTIYGTWTSGKRMLPLRLHNVTGKEGFLPFSYIWVTGTRKRLYPNKSFPDGPQYDAKAVWLPGNDSLSAFLRGEIFSIFQFTSTGQTLGQAMLADKKAFLSDTSEEAPEIPSQEKDLDLQVSWQDTRWLCLRMYNFSYTGGAHGMYENDYYCYDLQRRSRLTLTDVLDSVHYAGEISHLMEDQFRKINGMPAGAKIDTMLLVDSIPLTTNFYLTGKGIGFEYPPYAIGSYAMGSISFFFTYEQLAPYLQPEFKRVISPTSLHYPR